MHRKKQNLLVLAVVLLSILVAFTLFDVNYFPNASIAFFYTYLATLVYYVKPEKTTFHRCLYILIIILSVFLLIRSSPIVVALDIITILFLGSILSLTGKAEERLTNLLFSPLLVIVQAVRENNSLKLKLSKGMSQSTTHTKEKVVETAIIGVVSLVTFVVIGALLGSANQQLGSFLETLLDMFRLEGILKFIGANLRLDRLVIAVIFGIMALKYLSLVHANKPFLTPHPLLARKLDLRTPLLIASALITLFFIFQIDSHFASTASLSKQTNDIFAQLSAVCVIVFVLLINNKTKDKAYTTIKTVLYVQLLYLIILALRSDIAYISEWGLTHKRLYGLVVITWIVGTYGLYFKHLDRNQSVKKFYEYGIVFTSCLLVVVNILNFDNLIYKYKPSTHTRPIDHVYLTNLSADSNFHFEHFQELKKLDRTDANLLAQQDEWSFLTNLQAKYMKPDIRTFNLSEYLQYRKIKDAYLDPKLTTPQILRSE